MPEKAYLDKHLAGCMVVGGSMTGCGLSDFFLIFYKAQ
jgi:hypothetical protein